MRRRGAWPGRAAGVALLATIACRAPVPAPTPAPVLPADARVLLTVFLYGDAGAPDPRGEPLLAALERALAQVPGERLVVALGDNVYPRGLPAAEAPDRGDAERRLRAQLDLVVRTRTPAVFVPGNHDWAKSGADGLARVRRQDALVGELSGGVAEFLPHGGCPGPAVRDVGGVLRLVVLDTQWWLHPGERPEGDDARCGVATEAAVLAGLERALATSGGRQVLVAAHHPLASGGEHGGHFGWEDHLFPLRKLHHALWIPLPGLGSAYPFLRQEGISAQDLAGPANVRMRAALEGVLRRYRPLAWVDGHEHDLEVWDWHSARHLLVSGAGIFGRDGTVRRDRSTRFASTRAGWMRLEFVDDGRVRLGVFVVSMDGSFEEAYASWLD